MAKKSVDVLPMSVDATGIMETKLTRSEAIELMLEEAKEQISAKMAALEAERNKLRNLTKDEVIELATAGRVSFSWNRKGGDVNFTTPTKLPTWFVERQKRDEELGKEISLLTHTKYALDEKGKAKLIIMKQVLEGSEEGRKFLEDVSKMALGLTTRLIKAAEDPPKPQLETTTTVKVTTTVKES